MYHYWSLEAQFWSWFYLLVCKLTQESMHWFIEQLYSYSVIVYGSCCLCAVSSKTLKEAYNNCNPLPEYYNAAQVIFWWFIEVCLHIPFASCHLFSFFVHLPMDEVFRASTFCLLICRSGTITSSGNQCNQKVVAYLREVFCIRLKRILACLLISGKVFCMFTRLLFPLMYTVNLYEFNRLGLHL